MSPRRVILALAAGRSRDDAASMLVSLGYQVTIAGELDEILAQSLDHPARLLFTDQAFIARAGDRWLDQLRESLVHTPVIVLPPALTNAGADLWETGKPEAGYASELMVTVERVFGALKPARHTPKRRELNPFIGQSPEIRRLSEEALKALGSESPILIEGETGTGKGVLAAWLHRHGSRAHEPIVDLNCAGMSRELLDSDLFGHEKGSFTGAVSAKPGLLEVADRGTLFLDEIGEMDLAIQAKLLKVIEEKRFRRVGDTRERYSDVRIIAATNADLMKSVHEGRFRQDLFFRICVLPMRVPPLRSRAGDIPLLARGILGALGAERGRPEATLTPAAEQALVAYSWPGNVRELRSVLERALLEHGRDAIDASDLKFDEPHVSHRSQTSAVPAADGTLQDVLNAHILRVLEECGNDKALAAKRLNMARSTLYQRLNAMGHSRGRP